MAKVIGKRMSHSMHSMRTVTEDAHIRNGYLRRMEQYEKWRHAYETAMKKEKNLQDISHLSFEEKDYSTDLIRNEWVPAPPPDFGDWRGQINQEVEKSFQRPVLVRGIGLFVLFLGMLVSKALFVLSILLILEGLLAASIYMTFRKKTQIRKTMIEEKKEYIRVKMYEFLVKQKADKEKFEDAETERLSLLERLMNGEEASVLPRLSEVYRTMSFPFPLVVQVIIYKHIPLFKIWLPTIQVVPERICTLKDDGSLDYQDKTVFSRNKQYLEVCSATILQLLSVAYGNIPSFDQGMALGMVKGGDAENTYFSLSLSREKVIDACNSVSGVGGVQKLQGLYQWDDACQLAPVEPLLPDEWQNVTSLVNLPQIRVTIL